ncbi:ABC transporter permease, partial [Streptomyces sp. NPDC059556]
MSTTPPPPPRATPRAPPPRRRRGPRTWLAALPLIAFTGLCFGLPLGALLYGAVTRTDPGTGATSLTGEHLGRSLQGPYLGSLVGSVQLSALTALVGGVLGVVIAQAVVTSRSAGLRSAALSAS